MAAAVAGLALAALGSGARDAAAQGLAEYDYANLGLRGISAEAFVIFPSEVESAFGLGGRLDLGYLGPNVKVKLRGGYWSSELKDEEVELFETRIADLVEEQNGTRPTIDLGVIDRSAAIAGLDFHWVFDPFAVVRPYLGAGLELYVLSGSGAAIDETFVDDSLDVITAGASLLGGVEASLGPVFSVFGEGRASLAADLRSFGLAAGIGINWN